MDMKKLGLALLRAESEAEVSKIITDSPEMSNLNNWAPLDGRDTNFNITSNQASDGGKALTELMTNMVDAVLMKLAYEAGIDPKGAQAPPTMYKAVEKLIPEKRIIDGKLSSLDSRDPWLREFAKENLVIGVTGARKRTEGNPCFTFADNGEGQSADKFEDTFLSLSAGHKKEIPFVQGKFNMGSSGVLEYCGDEKYKLIISRRYDGESPWAWTLMRRRPRNLDGSEMQTPVIDYFILGGRNGDIPILDDAPISPFMTQRKEIYGDITFKNGTIVKLYDYFIGKTRDFRAPREALNENLVETILPFRMFDFRQTPGAARGRERAEGIDVRPFYGMEFLLLRSHGESELYDEDSKIYADAENAFPVGNQRKEIFIKAIPLKELPGWLQQNTSNNRIFHCVNGQVQFKQTRGYLSQQCGFPALKDNVVIIVDASGLNYKAHNEIWKGDREHIKQNRRGEEYKETIRELIKNSQALKDLAEKIAEQKLRKASKDGQDKLFEKMIRDDPTLLDLLIGKDPNFNVRGSETPGADWDGGKYSPTYVKLEGRQQIIEIAIDSSKPIGALTDAENGYLGRAGDCGAIILPPEIEEKFNYRSQLHNGRLVLYFSPVENALQIGEQFTFPIALHDTAMPEAVYSEKLTIKIVTPYSRPPSTTPPTPPKDPPSLSVSIPIIQLVGKDGTEDGKELPGLDYKLYEWPNGFDEFDGGILEDLGDKGKICKINYDNVYLQKRLKIRVGRFRSSDNAIVLKHITCMLIFMIAFENEIKKFRTKSEDEFDDDNFRRMAARAAAAVALPLSESLPKIAASIKPDTDDE